MGEIVRHEDYYLDTGRIEEFEQKLTELGIDSVSKSRLLIGRPSLTTK